MGGIGDMDLGDLTGYTSLYSSLLKYSIYTAKFYSFTVLKFIYVYTIYIYFIVQVYNLYISAYILLDVSLLVVQQFASSDK